MDYVDAYIGSIIIMPCIVWQKIDQEMSGWSKVAILECPTQNSVNERITGFRRPQQKRKMVLKLAREDTSGEFQNPRSSPEDLLSENSDIVAIMCEMIRMAVGAKTAMNVAEQGQILIYGVDGSPDIKKELKKTENQIRNSGTVSNQYGKRCCKYSS